MTNILVDVTYGLVVYWAIVLAFSYCTRYIEVTSYADQGCMELSQRILYYVACGGVIITTFIAMTVTFKVVLLLVGLTTIALFFT